MRRDPLDTVLEKRLEYLKLSYGNENFQSLAAQANTQHWSHLDYLARLIEGEAAARRDRAVDISGETAKPAVVEIQGYNEHGELLKTCTGFFISKDGYC